MQTNLEQAIEIIRALPVEDYGKLREVIDEEEKIKSVKKAQSNLEIERYKKARKWLDQHSAEYINQWVCLDGDKLIAHSPDGREVYQKAREAGVKVPFVHHIVEEPKAYWGGWL